MAAIRRHDEWPQLVGERIDKFIELVRDIIDDAGIAGSTYYPLLLKRTLAKPAGAVLDGAPSVAWQVNQAHLQPRRRVADEALQPFGKVGDAADLRMHM